MVMHYIKHKEEQMNIIVVDDERLALEMARKAVVKVAPDAEVTAFESTIEALNYAKENKVDVAFLDIEMTEMNGLALAKRLKDIRGETNVIFVTGYSEFMGNAFDMHASGYVLKPINPERVKKEIENLRIPIEVPNTGVTVQCFGNFAVFVEGKPLVFRRPKSKEALAYLVDRKGASVSKKELAAILWEDESYSRSVQSHLHILITDMIAVLKEAGAADIIIKQYGQYAVDTSKINCDYYNYEKGDAAAVNSYHGEYMSNYSWAEFTSGFLSDNS